MLEKSSETYTHANEAFSIGLTHSGAHKITPTIMTYPDDTLSRMPTGKSTYNEPNDLGLIESNVDHDVESSHSDHDHDYRLSPLKTNQSRKSQNQIVSTLSRTLTKVRTSDTLDPGYVAQHHAQTHLFHDDTNTFQSAT